MRAKLSIEAPGIRGALVFEGEASEVGKQLRQVIDLFMPTKVEGREAQPLPSASAEASEGCAAPAEPPAPDSAAPAEAAAPDGAAPVETAESGGEVPTEGGESDGTRTSTENSFSHLSFSTLALLFRCAHAFHLKQAGLKPLPSEDQKIGTDFHAGIAAFLRDEEYAFEYPQNEVRFAHIRELLSALRAASDLAVEPREVLEAGGIEWVGYADAIANGTIYEFKATKRLPTAPMDAHALQASVYAALFGAEKAKIVYVSEKEAREFEVAPFAGVREFLADMAGQIRAGVPNIPTGLTHPWGCDRCEYRVHCRFYEFVRGNGVTEIPF
jgi:CRISPR/Cas system-associated exonuclease Cas4 (RecB family)